MKLEITRLYGKSDDTFEGDAYEVTLRVDGKKVMSGDYYHDKIDHQIDGFKKALKFLKQKFTEKTVNGNMDWD